MTLKSNESLLNGKYIIERVLGQGGFGFVYLARDTIIGRPVAIKEMNPLLAEDDRMVRRFLIEGRATLQLRHPNIVEVYDVFSDRGSYYLAMEYCPGGALDERLDAKPMTTSEALAVMDQICAGVAYSHSRGIVHCDIKPANVLFGADGVAKVTDFGVAYVSPEAMTRSWGTVGGFAAGTLFYMAPEQLDGARDDPRIDVYSLGAMLYEMVTGKSYLDFHSTTTISDQVNNALLIKQGTPTSLHQLVPDAPAWLDEIVLLALSKQPTARYPDAGALRAALQLANPMPSWSPPVILPVAPDLGTSPSLDHRVDDRTIAARSWGLPGTADPARSTRPAWKWLVAGGSGVLVLAIVALRIIAPPPGPDGTTATPDPITLQSTTTVISPSFTETWTSSPTTTTQPPPTTAAATSTGTPAITPTATATPTPGPTATATASSTPTPTRTRAPTVTWTPTQTRGPASTSTPTPTPSPRVMPPVPIDAPVLLEPPDGTSVSGTMTFRWSWRGPPLGANEGYEVRIWKEDQPYHFGAAEPVRETSEVINLASAHGVQLGGSGQYFWTVAVVELKPYSLIGLEAPPRSLVVQIDTQDGGTDPTATPTELP